MCILTVGDWELGCSDHGDCVLVFSVDPIMELPMVERAIRVETYRD